MSFIGPALPPHLQKCQENDTSDEDSDGKSTKRDDRSSTSACNKAKGIGPVLPLHLRNTQNSDSEEETDTSNASKEHVEQNQDEDSFGPTLPPGLRVKTSEQVSTSKGVIGPAIPDSIRLKLCDPGAFGASTTADSEGSGSDIEGNVIGPMPSGVEADYGAYVRHQFEERALNMKKQLTHQGEEEGVKRESWMLELPDNKARHIGLGPRSFKMKPAPENKDRSVWTDTPADKERKAKMQQEGRKRPDAVESRATHRRDLEMDEVAKKHSHGRQESLLEMHQKKRKKQQKEEASKPTERRPFDRDVDLQVNRFDEAQKQAVIKKSRLLNDRFSSGVQKFL